MHQGHDSRLYLDIWGNTDNNTKTRVIASVLTDNTKWHLEDSANAHLIAASPKLLQVCEITLGELIHLYEMSDPGIRAKKLDIPECKIPDDERKRIAQLIALLGKETAKAEGRE